MAEVQTSVQSGEMAQRFVQFVMLQAQQAAVFLGRVPNPQSGRPEVRLEAAKLFIDNLEMIQSKTRGNLSREESGILEKVLADLRQGYAEAAGD